MSTDAAATPPSDPSAAPSDSSAVSSGSSIKAPGSTLGVDQPKPERAVLVMIHRVLDEGPGASDTELTKLPRFTVVPEDHPQLRATDLGLTRGDGVFETIGVFDGVPMNLGPHLKRLAHSAQMLDLGHIDQGLIAEAATAGIDAHDPVAELTVRVVLTRGVEGDGHPTGWVHARTAADYGPEREGIDVVCLDRGLSSTVASTSPWLLAGAKTISYAVNMAVLREAARRGAQDVLFVSSDGYALEGPTSTLLVKEGDHLVTTPADAGILAGTCIRSVFDALNGQYTCTEELMSLERVKSADAAWLLSSSRLVAPINHLDETALGRDHGLDTRIFAILSGRGENA
ncbi:aminotransferase class IV [Devriesea agamarum]|uniref:aminotransferase class IV n=1 Tax=Devriesea agamarum TaxID=472569 RepID=UPI001E3C726D|nr:aminotransferase class IV [Devriesea agamarum]